MPRHNSHARPRHRLRVCDKTGSYRSEAEALEALESIRPASGLGTGDEAIQGSDGPQSVYQCRLCGNLRWHLTKQREV